MRTAPSSPACVVKVGEGRGFIIEYRVKTPPVKFPHGLKPLRFVKHRAVVTAAHCLPKLPPAHAGAFRSEKTYKNLLGSLDGSKKDIQAECLFADPIADIAVLGCPDEQELGDKADAYHALIEDAPVLRIGEARSGRGWVLTLDRRWIPSTLKLFQGMWGHYLETDPTEAGQSGSPILSSAGLAVGVVVIGGEAVSLSTGVRKNERAGPQPILTHNLPGWLLREVGRKRGVR